jgi:hypothetical protein
VLGVFFRQAVDPSGKLGVRADELLQVLRHEGKKGLHLDGIEALPLAGEFVFLNLERRQAGHGILLRKV